jgi:hypothetical protein
MAVRCTTPACMDGNSATIHPTFLVYLCDNGMEQSKKPAPVDPAASLRKVVVPEPPLVPPPAAALISRVDGAPRQLLPIWSEEAVGENNLTVDLRIAFVLGP